VKRVSGTRSPVTHRFGTFFAIVAFQPQSNQFMAQVLGETSVGETLRGGNSSGEDTA